MRNSRRRRLRKEKQSSKQQCKQLKKARKKAVEETKTQLQSQEKRLTTLRCMARTFWERWRWEAERRKEALLLSRQYYNVVSCSEVKQLNEIDPALLVHPTIDGVQKECYLGRGSFGIVRLMVYRTMHVAVKHLHAHTVKKDVQHEAEMTAALCHPCLPLLFGKYNHIKLYFNFMGSLTPRHYL